MRHPSRVARLLPASDEHSPGIAGQNPASFDCKLPQIAAFDVAIRENHPSDLHSFARMLYVVCIVRVSARNDTDYEKDSLCRPEP